MKTMAKPAHRPSGISPDVAGLTRIRRSVLSRDVTIARAANVAVRAPRGLVAGDSTAPTPPGSLGWPYLGESLAFFEEGPLNFGLKRHVKYGPVFQTSLFGAPALMVTDMGLFKALMVEDTKLVTFNCAGSFGKLMDDFGTRILANVDGARMPFRRSLLAAVTNEALAGYTPKIIEIAQTEISRIAAAESWDLNDITRRLAMNFSNALLAGMNDLTDDELTQVRDDLGVYFKGFVSFDLDWPGTDLNRALAAKARLLARIRRSLQRQVDDMLREAPPPVGGVKMRKNMLGYLVDNQRSEGVPLDIDMLSKLALGILQAGTDTSSAGFSSMLACVAQLPGVMDKVREEQRQVAAVHGPELSKASLDASKYLDAVAKEAARILSPATVQTRTALSEFELGGYRIPKGTAIYLNVHAAHAMELAPGWPANEQEAKALLPSHMDISHLRDSFRPERWLVADAAQRPSLMTFGHGPHTCLGMSFYFLEAKVTLAHIARNYDLELLTPKIEWDVFPAVKPRNEVLMHLKPLPQQP